MLYNNDFFGILEQAGWPLLQFRIVLVFSVSYYSDIEMPTFLPQRCDLQLSC